MIAKKSVLYISYDGMTDPLGQSQVIPYLIALSEKGFAFTILSFEKKARYTERKDQIKAILDSAGIRWEPLIYTKSPPVLSTMYDYFRMNRRASGLHKSINYNLIHCRSYISALAGLLLKRKYNLPFIFDMRGFWANERVDGQLWNLKNPVFKSVYQFFKKKEIEFINKSAAIISLTKAAKDEILKWKNLQIEPDKITVIPCCVDTMLFDPGKVTADQQQVVRQKLNISKETFILGYLGSIGTWYMLDEMLQFFSLLKKQIAGAKFLFVTEDNPESIIEKAHQFGINADDIIITKAERKEVPIMISLFNYGIFFIKPAYSKIASSPTKQGEIMSMGVPVVCNSGVGDSDHIVGMYNSGFVVPIDDHDYVINEISAGGFDKQLIRNGAIDYFSLDKGAHEYLKVYNSILE
ncbi:MAG: glycosyltransferase [Bacteroidetes bacterium]|jgi:glycosyltransferase involved in cell wall biosynthesis|nr:glycosyltransferase [Bacteroidota bacterium]